MFMMARRRRKMTREKSWTPVPMYAQKTEAAGGMRKTWVGLGG